MALRNMMPKDRRGETAKSLKIFWEDPYAKEADVKITSVDGAVVTVDRTVAFAYPGGQLPDTGHIGLWPIMGAKYDNGEVYYTLDVNHRLKTGDTVTMGIDWDLRYTYMRLHFAAELVIQVLLKDYGAAPELLNRADILESRAVLEYAWDEGKPPEFGTLERIFPALEEKTAALVAGDHRIVSGWLDPETEKRFWEIPGFAKVPCNGTHIRRTGEVGRLRFGFYVPAPDIDGMNIYLADQGSAGLFNRE